MLSIIFHYLSSFFITFQHNVNDSLSFLGGIQFMSQFPPPFRVMQKKSAVTRISASTPNHPQNAETSPRNVQVGKPHSSRFVPPVAEELFTLPFQS